MLLLLVLAVVPPVIVAGAIWPAWLEEVPTPIADATVMVAWYVVLALGLALSLRTRLSILAAELSERLPTARGIGWGAVLAVWLVLTSLGCFYVFTLALDLVSPSLASKVVEFASTEIVVRGDAHATLATLLNVGSAILFAPFIEELVFRRFLFVRWSARWGVRKGMVASSLVFALMHGNPVGTFVFACVLCSVYRRTGSLWLLMLIHAVNNAIAVGLSSLQSASSRGPELSAIRASGAFGIVALAFGASLLWLWLRRLSVFSQRSGYLVREAAAGT